LDTNVPGEPFVGYPGGIVAARMMQAEQREE
jgi:hypothetical protein